MRANTVNGYKMCFPSFNKNYTLCKLGCQEQDSVGHSFSCVKIDSKLSRTKVVLEAIFDEEYHKISSDRVYKTDQGEGGSAG